MSTFVYTLSTNVDDMYLVQNTKKAMGTKPYGLLPCQLPADIMTVEDQCEVVPRDMRCYVDSEGNTYDFAFGLDWKGPINDKRVRKYQPNRY